MLEQFAQRSSASQVSYTRGLSAVWRNQVQLYDPSVWLAREPEIEEKMLRDPDIAHAVAFRKEMIAGRQWTVIPKSKQSPRAPIAVAIYTDLLGRIKNFTAARESLARAFLSGSRYAKIHGKPMQLPIGDGRMRTWIVPTWLEDYDKRMFRPVPKMDTATQRIDTHLERWHVGKDLWVKESVEDGVNTIHHVYQDDQSTLGHGRGLREALGWVWYTKTNVQQEYITYLERRAQGLVEVKVDGLRDADSGLPNEEVQDRYVETIKSLMARHVLAHDSRDEVTIIETTGSGSDPFEKFLDRCEKWVLKLVLSAHLPTSADKGGSFALSKTQENSQEMRFQFDREHMEETLTDGLLGWIEYWNWPNIIELGLADERPKFSIVQEEKLDPMVRAGIIQSMHTAGVPISMSDIYEQTGLRAPEPGEPILAGALPAMPDPFGGGFGGGGESDSGPPKPPSAESKAAA